MGGARGRARGGGLKFIITKNSENFLGTNKISINYILFTSLPKIKSSFFPLPSSFFLLPPPSSLPP
jgi:hypothetical protein